MRHILLVLLTVVLFCAPVLADTVYLKNGGKLMGKVTVKGNKVIIENDLGTMEVYKRQIERIEKDDKTLKVPKEREEAPRKSEPQAARGDQAAGLKKLIELLKEGKPAVTKPEAQSYLQELKPLVEEAAGRKFSKPPRIELVGRDKFADAYVRHHMALMKNIVKGLPPEALRKGREELKVTAALQSLLFLCRYSFQDRTIYLLPKNVEPIFSVAKVGEKSAEKILKAVIAHELVLALQHEEPGFAARLTSLKNLEELTALSLTMGGHAAFIQHAVATKLKLDITQIRSAQRITLAVLKFEDEELQVMNKIAETEFNEVHNQGRKFIEYYYDRGRNKLVWKILNRPPAKTSMVKNPVTYSPARPGDLDYVKILDRLENYFGAMNWRVESVEVGPVALISTYSAVDFETAWKIVSNMTHVQTLLVKSGDGKTGGNIGIIEVNDTRLLTTMVTALEKRSRNNLERLKKMTQVEFKNIEEADFPGIKADISRKFIFTTKPPNEKGFRQAFYRICRGKLFLEIFLSNLELEDKKVIELAEEVFKRYDAEKKSNK